LAAAIEQKHGIAPILTKGDSGVFEVLVDGRLIFSKQATGRFPTHEEILEQLG
jgi:selT/selW/selH-like putative selenoprotein